MPEIGQSLSHYSITGKIGKGGMGEVYRAKDQKLGRDVAIKVLPEEFAKDADRVARFQREAKLLASLNHPNIAAIHGLEESAETQFLVMELIEGDTLAEQIKRGPIPFEESLKLALQIAEALEAAHEKGVIHRDLKPANIKVTPEGKVKVLDFGLAKAFALDREEVNLSNSPTLSEAATQQGVILGTAAYMSPEQSRGKPVDKRTDIWAFGCVLFEMLAGRVAFQGEDVSEILASVIKGDLQLDLLPEDLHPRVREAITRCLQKDVRRRYSSITDARYEIEQALADPGDVFAAPVAALENRSRTRSALKWIAAVVAVGLLVAAVVWKLRAPEPRRVTRFEYSLPEGQQFNINSVENFGHTLAVSPDGSQIVYSTSKGLFLRSEEELEAKIIQGTESNPQSPFFSPDGKWVGYWSQEENKLKKIMITGGAAVALCDVTWVFGAIWYPDNTIVFSDVRKGIMRVSANGGAPETLIMAGTISPQILPGGKSVIFTDISALPALQIMVQPLPSGERKALGAGSHPRYL
ncbi:MAG: serine/threonine-protein kinase, partial [Acidobacteria bacterium]|nr:serine/threonine-protein kinase [Acidobacteriota bacterium]